MKSPVKVLPKRRRGRPTKEEALAWQELLNGSNKQQQSLINEESSSSSASIDTDDSTPSSSSSSSASSSPLVVAPSNSNVNGPASSTPKTQSRHAYRFFSGEEVTTDEIFDPTDSSDDESDIEIN